MASERFHSTVLNYTEEKRIYEVQLRNTVTDYLSLHDQITDANGRDGHCYELSAKFEKSPTLMILQHLYILVNHVLQPPAFNVLQRLLIEAADSMQLRTRSVWGSCIPDSTKKKAKLAFRRSGIRSAACYRCIDSKVDLAKGMISGSRTIIHSFNVTEQ